MKFLKVTWVTVFNVAHSEDDLRAGHEQWMILSASVLTWILCKDSSNRNFDEKFVYVFVSYMKEVPGVRKVFCLFWNLENILKFAKHFW